MHPPSHRHPTGQRPYYATLATSARPITELTSLVWSRSRGPAADVTRARHHDHEDDGVHPANTKMKIMYMCRAAAQAPSGAGAHTGEKHTSPSTSRRGWGVLSGQKIRGSKEKGRSVTQDGGGGIATWGMQSATGIRHCKAAQLCPTAPTTPDHYTIQKEKRMGTAGTAC